MSPPLASPLQSCVDALATRTPPSPPMLLLAALYVYLAAEVAFLLHFALRALPLANRRTEPHPYREYPPGRRHVLLRRILARMERTCRALATSPAGGETPGDDVDGGGAGDVTTMTSDFRRAFREFSVPWYDHDRRRTTKEGSVIDDNEGGGGDGAAAGREVKERVVDFDDCLAMLLTEEKYLWMRENSARMSSLPSSSSTACSSDDASTMTSTSLSSPGDDSSPSSSPPSFFPRTEDATDLLSWAFFAKERTELVRWEMDELDRMIGLMSDEFDISFEPGRTPGARARRLNLDDVRPLHRPLLLYVTMWLLTLVGGLVLRWRGFRRYVVPHCSGLAYWYRPGTVGDGDGGEDDHSPLPLLFFHGIAPAGLTFYIPMILRTFLVDPRREAFLFENGPISCTMCTTPVDEKSTVRGVLRALETHLGDGAGADADGRGVALAGHSFGSCQLTWLLRDPESSKLIRQLILLDPVTVLLSEPDVMSNFLYQGRNSTWWDILSSPGRAKIYLVASTELYTEHYLRRHFSWYNSELWLDDVPANVRVLICLSERDEIVHAGKVRREVEVHNREVLAAATASSAAGGEKDEVSRGGATTKGGAEVDLIYWSGVGHASCVTRPSMWEQVREAASRQERELLRRHDDRGGGGEASPGTVSSR